MRGARIVGDHMLAVIRGLVTLGFAALDVYVGFRYSLRSAIILGFLYFLMLPLMIWVTAWAFITWSDRGGKRDRGFQD